MRIEKKVMPCSYRALCSFLFSVSSSLLMSSSLFRFLVIFVPFITKLMNLLDHIHCFYFLSPLQCSIQPHHFTDIINITKVLLATLSGHLPAHSFLELSAALRCTSCLLDGDFFLDFSYFFHFHDFIFISLDLPFQSLSRDLNPLKYVILSLDLSFIHSFLQKSSSKVTSGIH